LLAGELCEEEPVWLFEDVFSTAKTGATLIRRERPMMKREAFWIDFIIPPFVRALMVIKYILEQQFLLCQKVLVF
jgi:hypothetical protein